MADAVAGMPRGGVARDWCRLFDFPQQQSFSISILGGMPWPSLRDTLRGARFSSINGFRMRGRWLLCSQAHIDAYAATEAWVDMMLAMDIEGPSFKRGIELQPLSPKLN